MRTTRTNVIAEIGLAIALFVTLHLLFRLVPPINAQGGSISLAMLPIFIIALRRGVGVGVLTGVLCGLTDMALPGEAFIVHPVQAVLDYPLAFGALGLAGLGSRSVTRFHSEGRALGTAIQTVLWCSIGTLGRYAFAVLSGVVFFSEYAEGQPVLLYSLGYNALYLLPALIFSAAAAAALVGPLWSRVPAPLHAAS